MRDQARRGLAQHETGALDFRHQRRDASLARGMLGATKRIAPASFAAAGLQSPQ